MKKLTCAIALAMAVLFIPPAEAAPKNVVTTLGNRFTPQTVAIVQGESLDYANLDWAPHTVQSTGTKSDGSPLFVSAVVRVVNGPVPVSGVEALSAGSYPFICIVHTWMTGTLTVTAN